MARKTSLVAKVPKTQDHLDRLDRLPQTALPFVHSKDTVQVSLWLCKSATVQNFFQQGWQRSPPKPCA